MSRPLMNVIKAKLCIFILSVFAATSFVFLYKTELLVGRSIVNEVNLFDNYVCESNKTMLFEDDLCHNYNEIAFILDDSASDFKSYKIQIEFLNDTEDSRYVEYTITPKTIDITCSTYWFDWANRVRIYIIGNIEDKINLEKLQMIHSGFRFNTRSLAYIEIFTLCFFVFFELLNRYGSGTYTKMLFYLFMLFGIAIYLIRGIITYGKGTISTLLLADTGDSFMDFINSIQYGTTPYEMKVIYPPLINCIYAIFGRFIPMELWDRTSLSTQYAARDSQYGRMLVVIFIILVTLFWAAFVRELKQGNIIEKYIFLFISLFTIPFLFALERGNSIIGAMVFLGIYIWLYDSSKPLYRHIAMICLAISVSIKIYPVIFALLLFCKKQWKDIGWCFMYGITIFFVPFCFLGGYKNIATMWNNIINTSQDMQAQGYGYFVDLKNIIGAWSSLLGIGVAHSELIWRGCWIIIAIGSILVLFGGYHEAWKQIAILCLLMILLPTFSSTYTLIYLLLPLIMFLDKRESNNKILDWFYMILFIIINIPFDNYIFFFTSDKYLLNVATLVEGSGIIFMLVFLYLEGIVNLAQNIRKRKKKYD